MVPRSSAAVIKDAPTKSRKEEYVSGMVLRPRYAGMSDVPSMLREEECAELESRLNCIEIIVQ